MDGNLGHNNPPDPIDECMAPYGDAISEAENWLDGEPVTNEGQMKQVDDLTSQVKAALKAVTAGEKSAAAPLHDAWKAEKARWKPTIDDLTRIRNGLIAAVSGYKAEVAKKLEADRRAKFEAAEKARIEAERAAAEAQTSDLEAQREADAKMQAAKEAKMEARQSETVKGLRTVHRYEITAHRDALRWIYDNDKDAMVEFIEEYVRRNHRAGPIAGVRTWTEKEAF